MTGALLGRLFKNQFSAANQSHFKLAIGAFAAFFGLRLVWNSLGGSFVQAGKQILIALLALMIGRLLGRLLRLQKISNRLGQFASGQITLAASGKSLAPAAGFNVAAVLFCAAPLAVIGALQDGLQANYVPLVIKAAMDGLAAMSFARMFGAGVTFAALPVFVYQGTLTLLSTRFVQPFLEQHALMDSENIVTGLLVMFISVVIFELRKVELADYLPALAVAPLLTWLWR